MCNMVLDLLKVVEHLDSMSSVGVFPRLDDPPTILFVVALELFELLML